MSRTKSRCFAFSYLFVLGLTVCLGFRPAQATIFVQQDAAKLTTRSDVILLGRVETTTTRWEAGRIVTEAVVRTEDAIKGTPESTVLVIQPGGKVGDIAMRVLGGAELHTGDRAVLFLAKAGPALRIVGLAQGKLDVERTRTGGEVVHLIPAGAKAPVVMPLHDALEHLRTLVRSQ